MDDIPAIMDLPGSVLWEICAVLDSSTEHNWQKLIEQVPNYKLVDVMALRNLAQQGASPSNELMLNLNSQGWTILELANAARKSGIMSVIDTLSSYCEEEGIEVDLACEPTAEGVWIGAKSCLDRSPYPSDLEPPSSASALQESYKRYNIEPPLVKEDLPSRTTSGNVSSGIELSSTSDIQERLRTPPPAYHELPPASDNLEEVRYEELVEATDHFDNTPYKEGGHKVGEGGFGEVFQCHLMLQNGLVHVAVKVLLNKTDPSTSGTSAASVDSVDRQQFSTEIQALSKLSHDHLLPMLAYSCNGPQLCLIYPFMSNGSLEAHLPNKTTLNANTRLTVARDVASALDYLHCLAEKTIVHRDVKSANVLLSKEWRGKLGDFGLARSLPPSLQHSSVLTATIVGTPLYMSPEAVNGLITPAADIYAFGIVLYELLTGRCALNKVLSEDSGEDTDLLTYLEEYEGEREELLLGKWDEKVWQGVWSLAELCTLHRRKKRPTSMEILKKLENLCCP